MRATLPLPTSDVGFFADDALHDPYPAVLLSAYDAWVLPRYDHVRAALSDHERFSSAHGVGYKDHRAAGSAGRTVPCDRGCRPSRLTEEARGLLLSFADTVFNFARHRQDDQFPLILAAYCNASALLEDTIDQQLRSTAGIIHLYYTVMVRLSDAPDRRLRMTDLAEQLTISRGRLTHAVRRLEEDGWVRRENCSTDRRTQFAVLTDEGMAALARIAPGHAPPSAPRSSTTSAASRPAPSPRSARPSSPPSPIRTVPPPRDCPGVADAIHRQKSWTISPSRCERSRRIAGRQ